MTGKTMGINPPSFDVFFTSGEPAAPKKSNQQLTN